LRDDVVKDFDRHEVPIQNPESGLA